MPTLYYSTDASAPVLTGQTDALNTLLHAILVTGYGAKSAAGWTREYVDGSVSVYRPAAGRRGYLRIDDTAAQLARVQGYQAMTSASVGTGLFPLPGQYSSAGIESGGLWCLKSMSADATARPWFAIATDEAFYLILHCNVTVMTSGDGGDRHLAFGTLKNPAWAGDQALQFLAACSSSSTTSTSVLDDNHPLLMLGAGADACFVESDYTGLAQAHKLRRGAFDIAWQATTAISGSTFLTAGTYPDPASGHLHIARVVGLSVDQNSVRASMPGLWALPHTASSFANHDTFSGVAGSSLAGRTFVIVRTATGGVVFETTSGSW